MSWIIKQSHNFLFVPASRPERFAKAFNAGADCVSLDLQDAVPAEQKQNARELLARALEGFTAEQLSRTLVRINAVHSSWHDDDVNLLATWTAKGLAGVMVPKAEVPAELHLVGMALGESAALVPLIESLAGMDAASPLAQVPQVSRLAFGHLDFQLDLGMRCSPDESELTSVRFDLVAASRRANLVAPIDGVTVDTSNSDRLKSDSERGKALGFGGKLCIHPSQLAVVSEVYAPSQSEIEWARRVVAEARSRNGETFSLDGRMVDLPVVLLAERSLASAGVATM
jgi:citrate lyase subunit beta/citryl-CoA lyase